MKNTPAAAESQPSVVTITIPRLAENAYLFRRDFVAAIRGAISYAQIAGTIDTDAAVACFNALPVAEPTTP
jgi:hypothetical protein